MKTAIYIRSLLHGGAEKQALLLAELLQNEQPVTVIVHINSLKDKQIDYRSIHNIVFLKGNIIQKGISLFRILKRDRIHNLICYLPINNIVGTFIGKLAGTKNILCGIRGSKHKGYFRTCLMKIICNKLDIKFISNSYNAKEKYISRGFKSENIVVIPNGINIPNTNNTIIRSINDKEKYTLLSIGRFITEKDFTTLIDAIELLVHKLEFNNIELIIIGYGPLKNMILEKITYKGLSNNIKVIDGTDVKMNDYFLNADIYISSSIHEGMSNTIMEAMSYKLPIVATNAGDTNKLVINNYNGFVVDKKSPEQIAYQIRAIFTEKDQYPKICDNSLSQLKNNFSTHHLLTSYKQLIKNE